MLSGVAACTWPEPSARMLTTIPAKSNRGNHEHITFSPLVYIAIGRERQEFRELRTGPGPVPGAAFQFARRRPRGQIRWLLDGRRLAWRRDAPIARSVRGRSRL